MQVLIIKIIYAQPEQQLGQQQQGQQQQQAFPTEGSFTANMWVSVSDELLTDIFMEFFLLKFIYKTIINYFR